MQEFSGKIFRKSSMTDLKIRQCAFQRGGSPPRRKMADEKPINADDADDERHRL